MLDTHTISIIAITVLFATLLWDAYLVSQTSKNTMSRVISDFNSTTGGLLALLMAALWIHWFVPLPASWVGKDFLPAKA
jgi:hypothetical protein